MVLRFFFPFQDILVDYYFIDGLADENIQTGWCVFLIEMLCNRGLFHAC